ncbi:mannosyltransferase [Sphaerospermopsis sp. LEGE 08334]|uniref:mannosyltransferase n=1 Tax=Sphaerospermopsis sp. LEGE 08334 TaxID=1828651 RepID=UPI0018804BB4|nr:mannosyltransferase [Sphaerospermopsis sp. LEGE 08334]MBE9056430.1 mannosyltransferase [Sphaerospermopsis sp. LEGE 08334]
MIQHRKNIQWTIPFIICGAFILCAAIGMLFNQDAFHKFFSATQLYREIPPQLPHRSYYWDVEHYSEMALNPSCKAFYPLWPFIIRNLFHPQTIEQAAHYFLVVATVIFLINNFLLYRILKICLNRLYLAYLILLIYTVNPMAIFRVIGYTESIFSLLSTLFIWVCLPNLKINLNLKLCFLFIITFLMSLTRPILIQVFFATILTLITIIGLEMLKIKRYSWNNLLINLQKYRNETKITLTIWVASLLGYAVYGSFCLKTRGNFFAPFDDQSLWGRTLGIHLELLLFPKSPLVDIIGLYLPVIILLLSLVFTYYKFTQRINIICVPKYRFWWNILYLYPPLLILVYAYNFMKSIKSKINLDQVLLDPITLTDYTNNLAVKYIFWFCIYFATAHSLINFLTFDRLMSLARHTFATPFFFVSLGYLYRCIPGKVKYQTLLFMSLISAFMLVEQWIKYGQDKWLG